jgi:hypothetical protein
VRTAEHGPKLGPVFAFTDGMDAAFRWAVPIALLAFALSFFLREVKLRTTLASAPGPSLSANGASGANGATIEAADGAFGAL